MRETDITLADIQRELCYERETGIFTRIRTGKPAGSQDADGHRQIRVCGRLTMAHRIAWHLMTGSWPSGRLDHRDGNPDNNAWTNLRLATPAQNTCNSRRRSDNKSGLKGASYHPSTRKWQATAAGVYLGLFETREEAHGAYCKFALQEYGDYARLK